VNVNGPHPTLTVVYQTQSGTAVDGKDFVAVSGTLTIADTASSGEADVSTIDDNVFGADEIFMLKLLKKTSSFDITKAVGTAHLHSDDPLPTISITNERRSRGDNTHETNEKFTVELSNATNSQLAGGGSTLDAPTKMTMCGDKRHWRNSRGRHGSLSRFFPTIAQRAMRTSS
jgi:Calx-beta domain